MPKTKPKEHSNEVTYQINAKAFELLENHPKGLRWSELLSKIIALGLPLFIQRRSTDVSGNLSKVFLTKLTNHLKDFSFAEI